MSETKRFEFAVIGGGSAGYAAARTAVDEGFKTVVIEGGREVGGLCILRGCMPTKALLYAAEVRHLAKHAATWGITVNGVGHDFPAVMARKNEMIGDFAEYRHEQLNSGKFEFIRANAAFINPHTVQLSNGETVRADRFVIATGSRISRSPLPALEEIGYLTSDSGLALEKLPRSIIVLGGGAIAVEFAQFFCRMGVETTLIQRSERILKDFDDDAAKVVETVFRNEGMDVFTGTKILNATKSDDGKTIQFEHGGEEKSVVAEEIFFALGRSPNTDSLDLEQAGVESVKGRIRTNEFQQTSTPHIYSAGDCCGPHEIVHIAIQQGELAAKNSNTNSPTAIDYRLLASVVFTDPQVAHVGLTERTAKKASIDYLTADYPFEDHGKSLIMEAKHGFVKLMARRDTGEIIGGSCVGPVGGELIHEVIVAMAARMDAATFAQIPHYHPTLAEIWTYPAEDLAEQIGS
ncbi:MAG: pyridine nucleotide-disulfide oxidoreductase [Verrucomicrobiales bacterium]|nr:pyridine nucleotide-disulfide oxidoreductase [Verrucomicrobiales bacterium]|tara:strand:- start:13424 stop:14812 length:1389 start_codon:yes stop_codon:yes gene_type:complete